jgi:ketosteroid isomerase-like protein
MIPASPTATSEVRKEPQVDAEAGQTVLNRLYQATNAHDIDAFVDCFAADYRSDQPVYPNRHFIGAAQVRENWSTIFDSVPDFHASLLRSTIAGDTVWSEWHWTGTKQDGNPLDMAGIMIMGIHAGRIAWGRLYIHDVEQQSAQIDEVVRRMTREDG